MTDSTAASQGSRSPYAIELIPNEDKLYLRVSGSTYKDMPYDAGIIVQQGTNGISVDWCRYSTAEECLSRGNPNIDAVVSFNAGKVRELEIPLEDIKKLSVEHAPSKNRAHSLIVKLPGKGRKNDKRTIRNLLYGVMDIEIRSPNMIDD